MRYTFADCELDTQLYTLWRAGQPRPLRPKVFHVLRYLVEHRYRVVSKQELLAHVWAEDSQTIVAAVPGSAQFPMARCRQIVTYGAGNP